MKAKKILWAYDDSDESKYALKYAVYFAKLFGSQIRGLHVNTISFPKYGHYPYYAHFIEDVAKEVNEDYKHKFKRIDNSLASKGIKFISNIVRGDPGDEIPQFIKKKYIDLAVMGVTGRGLIGRMLIGSTTQKVLNNSNIPILAIKKPKKNKKINIKKILVPIDISENNPTSLKSALELAQKIKSNITVIYILNVGTNLYEFPTDVIDKIISGADQELKKNNRNCKEKIYKRPRLQSINKIKNSFWY